MRVEGEAKASEVRASLKMKEIGKVTAADLGFLRAALGRAPRGLAGVATRCTVGLPIVIVNRPFLSDGYPFPTTFWLVCPKAVKAVSSLEASGLIGEIEREIASDANLRAALLRAQVEYAKYRKNLARLAHPSLDTGIGGVRHLLSVKCLHAHYAHYLAGGQNPIGKRVSDLLAPPNCSKRCLP